jgi:ketosteroid isomerase-like protein
MSSENVEAVRRFIDAFNRLDMDLIFADAHEDIQLDEWPEGPGARSYRGIDGVRQALDTWFETWEWMKVEIEQIVDLDDRVMFTLHQRAKGRVSAIEVEIRSYNVYSFQDGKVIRLQLFTQRESALEAAGLSSDEVGLVQKSLDAHNRGDLDAMLALLHPDAEVREWPEGLDARTYRGEEGIRRARESWGEAWEWVRVEPREWVVRGEKVLVSLDTTAKGRGSSAEVRLDTFGVYTVRDSRIAKIELFADRDPAFRAAGLSQDRTRQEAR